MRNRLGYVLLGALALAGCPSPTVQPDTGVIFIPDTGMHDTNPMMPDRPDTGPPSCNATGLIGAHCRTSGTQCQNGAQCFAFGTVMTIQDAFGIPAGILSDPMHPDYQAIDTGTMPETADFNGAEGSICAQQCNTAVDDTCGACTTCSAAMTQMPLMAAFGGILTVIGTANRMFGADTGICRLDCTFDPATRGDECPDEAFTCDRFGGVCVEACTSDNECNTAYGATYDGELVTLVNHDHADVCNMTTGRCEQPAGTGTASAVVGTHCESAADCAPTNGICLNGGRCAEFGCATPGAVCGGTATAPLGICLTVNATSHSQALCLQGCTTANDCGPGNVCAGLVDGAGNPGMIGPFGGYCIGVCDSDSACIATESCTDYNTIDAMTGAVTANNGRCVPRCTNVGAVGTGATGDCATDEWCSPDATNTAGTPCTTSADCASHAPFTMCSFGVCRSSVPTFGQCSPLGAFCGESNTNHLLPHQGDCATTQVCDETLATPHTPTGAVDREIFGDGHCVNPCTTAADCTSYPTGSVCVPTGPYAGLCRIPCTGLTMPNDGGVDAGADGGGLSSSECPADQTCDTAAGFCVEVAPPAA